MLRLVHLGAAAQQRAHQLEVVLRRREQQRGVAVGGLRAVGVRGLRLGGCM
jgi:hypothetical protein